MPIDCYEAGSRARSPRSSPWSLARRPGAPLGRAGRRRRNTEAKGVDVDRGADGVGAGEAAARREAQAGLPVPDQDGNGYPPGGRGV